MSKLLELRDFVLFFEIVFAIDIVLKFCREFYPLGETIPVRDHSQISNRYLKGEFVSDFIPSFPITFILDMSSEYFGRLFFLLKILRLFKGSKVFSISLLHGKIK
jgi:hypothetical protein